MTETELGDALQDLADAAGLPREHVQEVHGLLSEEHELTEDALLRELRWFYVELGLPSHYFRATPLPLIARHVRAMFAAKVLARSTGGRIDLRHESEDGDVGVYVARDDHAVTTDIERRIEQRFPRHRLQSYRSTASASSTDPHGQLRLYFVNPTEGADEGSVSEDETDFDRVAAPVVAETITAGSRVLYERVVLEAVGTMGLVIHMGKRSDLGIHQIILAHRRGRTQSYFSAVSDVLNNYGLRSHRKFIEHFKNGIVLYNIHLDDAVPDSELEQIHEDLSLVFVLPDSRLRSFFHERALSAGELVYAYAAGKFAHQFLVRYSREYQLLAPALSGDPVKLGILGQFKVRLSKDTFTEERIDRAIQRNLPIVKELYADFARHHFISPDRRPEPYDPAHGSDLEARIAAEAGSSMDSAILTAFLTFNRHVLKTNFYRDSKTALSFRLDTSFLSEDDYADRPHGIFLVVGDEFVGFHVRFSEVARGGIRIVRSRNVEAYGRNNDFLFDEAYNLARTQQIKNKDIPEGGSKGTVLLRPDRQDRAEVAFRKYVDALLDLLLPNEEIADHLGQEEILFLGPDEGTADLMDWAIGRARTRGYPFWRSFGTGKSVALGGIPHDRYGMTTRSVHRIVLGVLERVGLAEEDVSKLQTGGPDGDLGSNEIKISHDRTTSIVDGSGVLHDPNGIDRVELGRLAEGRQTVSHFDRAKLGPGGFLVTTEERDVTLPDGSVCSSGLSLRDGFHLDPRAAADLFVPCGGRPDAVHVNNVSELLDERGQPRFKFIVEGANLFLTQPARRMLEKAGVVLYKDATANKGGVTCSSLEVLTALALDDAQFAENMQVKDGREPPFYRQYVVEVQERIEENAALEFDCIWREHERTGTSRCDLTDQVGEKINQLSDDIQRSTLAQDSKLRHRVLREACPAVLLALVPVEQLLERLPPTYLAALVASHVASRYIYAQGLGSSELRFLEFVEAYRA